MRRPEAGALVATVGIYIFFAAFAGGKFTASAGTATWLNPAAELGIVSLPVGLLMIAGELDLSVGSVLASSSLTVAIISGYWGQPIILGIAVALALGLAIGFANGLLVTRTRVPSFVVTLATNFALQGLALGLTQAITGSTSVAITPEHWAKSLIRRLRGAPPVRGRGLLVAWRHRGRGLAPACVAVRELDLRGWRRLGKRSGDRHSDSESQDRAVHGKRVRGVSRRDHPDDQLQQRANGQRPVFRVQLDHRRRRRRRAAHRGVRFRRRGHLRHSDVRDCRAGHLLHRLGPRSRQPIHRWASAHCRPHEQHLPTAGLVLRTAEKKGSTR